MKRFLLFKFDNYYPEGGMNDFAADFDTVDSAELYLLNIFNQKNFIALSNNYQLLDVQTGSIKKYKNPDTSDWSVV